MIFEIDTSGLHCPMPLLKLKMTLRQQADQADDVHIRLISTDPMSQQDIKRYCDIADLVCIQHPNDDKQNKFIFDIHKK
ncbi:sulfurtransferase TusA family protein [Aquirhabdus parva]|uniref:Sulfurtransferase TusA family protein n=1 Tax=Aquirhabdus parva TaxID=2283318 RepID=A0A345P628_9GAMM|nr:sulfurtransferase TusA family protein [Aquirhabdus parva]AXI02737.1 sulfurtransferase TusA family protein [Aquirhabdus parva]